MKQKQFFLSIATVIVIFALTVSGCGTAPKPTPVVQEQPVAMPQESSPSEADLYATAIASLGGQLTETAIVEESHKPPVEEQTPNVTTTAEGGMENLQGMPTAEEMISTPVPQTNYESNYNPNLDPNYNPNAQYGQPSSGYYNPYYNPAYPIPGGGGQATYVVQPGDWLYNIARKFGVSPDAIVAANPGVIPNSLYPGQVLVIPNAGMGYNTTITVQPGDTINSIASRYGVTVEALMAANPGLNYYNLTVGQVLRIPTMSGYGQPELRWYPRFVSTSVWYPEYYWSYGNPSTYPDWYLRYGTPVAPSTYLPQEYWKYGPENWGTIPQYALCSSGRSQSPINIDTNKTTSGGPQSIQFSYRQSDVRLVSNDFTFQIDIPQGSSMIVDGVNYQLMNVTFHMPSEHTINGKPYYMEIQLVHYNSNTGKWAIASIFVNESSQDNSAFAPIWFSMPSPPYNWAEVKNFDLNSLIPIDKRVYSYTGSITTPPCTEGINWYVFAAPIELSRSQIERYRSMYPYNARPVQPLNDRTVYLTTLK